MAGDEVRVDPDDLRAKAAQIVAICSQALPELAPTSPPDSLSTSQTAVDNLNQNAKTLAVHEAYGRVQGMRLAETLRLVADAYATVDQNAMDNINNAIPGEAPAPPAPVTPGSNDLPEPPLPEPLPIPRGPDTGEYLDVPTTQSQLLGPDQTASLQAAAASWLAHSAELAEEAAAFETSSVNWEGEAADAAYRKFNDYRGFLVGLSGAWARLAGEAEDIAAAHASAVGEHTPIAAQYEALQAQLQAAILNGGSAARVIQLQMEELQQQSEELRHQYAREAQPRDVNPPEPPTNTGSPPTPVRGNGDPRQPARQLQGQGGGGQPGAASEAAQQAAPQDAPVSPMSAAEQAGQGAPQGGSSPGGGSPSGGSPGGGQGGSPSGGAPGGAPSSIPGLGKGDPKLPNDPSLRPAGAGGGGSGGGGGGMPTSPLQPAVGAETVAPTPISAPGAPAASGGSGGGGAAGGGMGGGMAPMMGAGRGGGESGDKKRNPQLSQDEDLYTEDRPWTEAVVGNRARRRSGSDDSKKES